MSRIMTDAKQLASHFVVMNRDLGADVVEVSDTLYAELDEKYGGFAGHSLIASHSFDSDWPTWEMHPAGDEFVMLLSGAADMVLLQDGDENIASLDSPGSFVIVPRGTWHTARVAQAATMLFVTPGEGTENRVEPER